MTAEEVKALQVGETVSIQKEGHEPITCIVAFRGSPANKFLSYREKGKIKKCAILDYPGKRYSREGSENRE